MSEIFDYCKNRFIVVIFRLRNAVKEGRLSKLILFMRQEQAQPLSQQRLAELLKVKRQKTIADWEKGVKPSTENQEKIAAHLGKSLVDLRSYVAGDLTLEEFIYGVPKTPRSQQYKQILEWLPNLQIWEVLEVGRCCFESIRKHFHPTELPDSVEAVGDSLTAEGMKSFLTELSAGRLPTNGRLVTLAHDLDVPTEILMKLCDRVQNGSDSKKEEQTNGA